MADFSVNNQGPIETGYTTLADQASETTKGRFGSQEVFASTEVDATTKDDECASSIKAEKESIKARKKKDKDAKKLNALQRTAKNQHIQEQDQRNRRVSKNTELRLQQINQSVSKDLSGTIQERSQKLFDGSEKTYQDCFEELELAAQQKACTPDKIAKTVGRFEDIAEQHNALQIIVDVWERKLTNLKGLAKSQQSEKDVDPQTKQQDQEAVQQQIQELEANLEAVKQTQTDLMTQHGARIEDSYKLAPLLREATAHYTHDITLPPKSFNTLILDKLLPLKGDPAKTFDCLTKGLIDGVNPSSGSAIEHFNHNLDVIIKCLSQELRCCPDKAVSAAIVNTIRSMEKFSTVQETNCQAIGKLASVVDYEKTPLVTA